MCRSVRKRAPRCNKSVVSKSGADAHSMNRDNAHAMPPWLNRGASGPGAYFNARRKAARSSACSYRFACDLVRSRRVQTTGIGRGLKARGSSLCMNVKMTKQSFLDVTSGRALSSVPPCLYSSLSLYPPLFPSRFPPPPLPPSVPPALTLSSSALPVIDGKRRSVGAGWPLTALSGGAVASRTKKDCFLEGTPGSTGPLCDTRTPQAMLHIHRSVSRSETCSIVLGPLFRCL